MAAGKVVVPKHAFSAVLITAALLILALGCSSAFAQDVSTNQTSYYPGDTVSISGSGWQPGETVNLVVTDISTDLAVSSFAVTTNSSGDFEESYPLPDDSTPDVTYTVTASDSSNTVTTPFVEQAAWEVADEQVGPAPKTENVMIGFTPSIGGRPWWVIKGDDDDKKLIGLRKGDTVNFIIEKQDRGRPGGLDHKFTVFYARGRGDIIMDVVVKNNEAKTVTVMFTEDGRYVFYCTAHSRHSGGQFRVASRKSKN
jgi:hypothetical protein